MKIVYYLSKTIAAYDLKVVSYTELNDLMKLHEYQRSRSLFDLPHKSLHFQPKLSQICSYGISSSGLKHEFETAVVNELSVIEPLQFYCM